MYLRLFHLSNRRSGVNGNLLEHLEGILDVIKEIIYNNNY